MKKLLLLACFFCTGCAALQDWWKSAGDDRPPARTGVQKQSGVNAASAVKGVKSRAKPRSTAYRGEDEMLFREALLSLRPNRETVTSKRGRQLLNRLKKEYPSSTWTAHAASLIELINIADELNSENKDLKAAKESLARQVEELSSKIEEMKKLDVELEKAR